MTRTVGLPAKIVVELRNHMTAYTGPDVSALVSTGPLGGVLRRGNFRRTPGSGRAAMIYQHVTAAADLAIAAALDRQIGASRKG